MSWRPPKGRAREARVYAEGEIKRIHEACRVAAESLELVRAMVRPGVTTRQLDREVERHIRARGGAPCFKGYCMAGKKPFPAAICASPNEWVVHGIPDGRRLQEGDIISVDVGVVKDDYYGDAAWSFAVGQVPAKLGKLLEVGETALMLGIAEIRPGAPYARYSRAVQAFVEAHGFSVVRAFVGHGIGSRLHEAPQLPNFVSATDGNEPSRFFREGNVVAVEPMVNAGAAEVEDTHPDWPVRTKDGAMSVHFEHTVAVVEGGARILTLG